MQGLPFDDGEFNAPPTSAWISDNTSHPGGPPQQPPSHSHALPPASAHPPIVPVGVPVATDDDFYRMTVGATGPPVPLPNSSSSLPPPRFRHNCPPSPSHQVTGPIHAFSQPFPVSRPALPPPPGLAPIAPPGPGPSPARKLTHLAAAPLPDTSSKRRPRATRSAVEEARMRAQREAESFANHRRDTTPGVKRESVAQTSAASAPASATPGKQTPTNAPRVNTNTANTTANTGSSSTSGERRAGKRRRTGTATEANGHVDKGEEDDSETEKKERYQRRLDMNRESAAVSRVRRRVYVKELEERLAAVEAEKLQLEGKLEIMLSQNDHFKKQLDNLFLMVTGRRPLPGPGIGSIPIGPGPGQQQQQQQHQQQHQPQHQHQAVIAPPPIHPLNVVGSPLAQPPPPPQSRPDDIGPTSSASMVHPTAPTIMQNSQRNNAPSNSRQ